MAAPSDAFSRAAAALLAAQPGLELLPVPSKNKHPSLPHKPAPLRGGALGPPRWRRDVAAANLHKFDQTDGLGLLAVNGLLVIDFDDMALYEEWHALFASSFDATVAAKTRKGMHVFYKRTPLCDELQLTDGPLGSTVGPDGRAVKKPLDLKTITSRTQTVTRPDGTTYEYATPGFVEVAPTKNKTWLRSPTEHAILAVPDEVARKLSETRGTKTAASRAARAPRGKPAHDEPAAKRHCPGGAAALWKPCVDLNAPCLTRMGFDAVKVFDAHEYPAAGASMQAAGYVNGVVQFKLAAGTPCPLCAKPDGHANAYWLGVRADGSRRVLNHSQSCQPGGRRVAVLVPWTAAGRARWAAAARSAGEEVPDCAVSELARLCPALFGGARHAYRLRGRLVVCVGPSSFVVVPLTLPDCYGYPCVQRTSEPWVEQAPPAAQLLSVPLSALLRLLRAS